LHSHSTAVIVRNICRSKAELDRRSVFRYNAPQLVAR